MAHFALVENGIVVEVIAVSNEAIEQKPFPESEPLGQALLAESGLIGQFLQCSYNGSFRGSYPGKNWLYDATVDEFIPPAVTNSVQEIA